MSTSLLYHALNIVGYRYRSTEYVGNEIVFTVEQDPSTLRCPCCGSRNVSKRGATWRRFLVITAPVDGVIGTKDVEALSGKKLEAGEPFCEIAELSRLSAEIYVPEDRIMRVKPGQTAELYLNNEPRTGYPLKVDEIAPRPEVEPRFGNVYRVRSTFVNPPKSLKVGMKGVGSIDTGTTSLWTILTQRLSSRWNSLWLHFL